MSCRLWKQKVFVDFVGMNRLQNQTFWMNSQELEPHRIHGLEDDENPHRADGCHIGMLVQPVIRAYGNNDGEDYHQCKIWSKGVVWLYGI